MLGHLLHYKIETLPTFLSFPEKEKNERPQLHALTADF